MSFIHELIRRRSTLYLNGNLANLNSQRKALHFRPSTLQVNTRRQRARTNHQRNSVQIRSLTHLIRRLRLLLHVIIIHGSISVKGRIMDRLGNRFVSNQLLTHTRLNMLLRRFIRHHNSNTTNKLMNQSVRTTSIQRLLSHLRHRSRLSHHTIKINSGTAQDILHVFKVSLQRRRQRLNIRTRNTQVISRSHTISNSHLHRFTQDSNSNQDRNRVRPLRIIIVLRRFSDCVLSTRFVSATHTTLQARRRRFTSQRITLLRGPRGFLTRDATNTRGHGLRLSGIGG